MKIRYLGHSCFLLTSDAGTKIVTDPYGDVGFSMPRVSADAVTVSHSHYDHCNTQAVEGVPAVFAREGEYELGGVKITAVKSLHDDVGGAARGGNLIFKFQIDGLHICHLGDLGEDCSPALVKAIAPADVLLLPVGGKYTVGAVQAKEYVDRIRPAVVIPMHYKTEGLELDIAGADEFTALFEKDAERVLIERTRQSEIVLLRDDVSQRQKIKIILMERRKQWN